jgi:aspartyl-tRNA synthetase
VSCAIELARRLELLDKEQFNFVWVTDFPLVEYDDKEKRFQALHHPFTAPREKKTSSGWKPIPPPVYSSGLRSGAQRH